MPPNNIFMKTKRNETTVDRPGYSIEELAATLNTDAGTLRKYTRGKFEGVLKSVGNGPTGPIYTKTNAVLALLLHRRGGKAPTTLEFMRGVFYAGCRLPMRGDATPPNEALDRWHLAQWRGVDPDELRESII